MEAFPFSSMYMEKGGIGLMRAATVSGRLRLENQKRFICHLKKPGKPRRESRNCHKLTDPKIGHNDQDGKSL